MLTASQVPGEECLGSAGGGSVRASHSKGRLIEWDSPTPRPLYFPLLLTPSGQPRAHARRPEVPFDVVMET